MAYSRKIEQNTSDSHQTSPGYVLTFTRWRNRDTLNYLSEGSLNTRKPLTVVNDAVQISVSTTKNSPTSTFSCRLKAGDLNYITAIHPGDFVTVNMLNFEEKAMKIRTRALQETPINKYDDGFKGVFKIIDVRMVLVTSATGLKEYMYDVTGRGFDEFNSLLYYNPAITEELEKSSPIFFLNSFSKNWASIVEKRDTNNIQELIKSVIKTTIGTGTAKAVKGSIAQDSIPRFLMPAQLGALLNRGKKLLYASDINNYYVGIWDPGLSIASAAKPQNGFASFFEEENDGNFFKAKGSELEGSRRIVIGDFSNVSVWSLLKDYSNPVLNESYVTYRVAPDGYVYPSVIVRQKPFNTRKYQNNPEAINHTQFLDLPQWNIDPKLILNMDIGRSENGRINFVQVFTRSLSIDPKFNQAEQLSGGNYVADNEDIQRSGMKPFIVTCNYDYPESNSELRASKWANLVGDWVMNGHLKMNGRIQCVGIEQPISIGDNLEFDDVVYQIETVTHTMNITPTGFKSFRSNITLSMGIDKKSTDFVPVYGEMEHTDSFTKRKEDYKYENVLPGFSDTQSIPSRRLGEEVNETKQETFTNPKSGNVGSKRKKKD